MMTLLKHIARAMIRAQYKNSVQRGHLPPDYNFIWFFNWLIENGFKDMVLKAIETEDQDIIPSVDRKDPSKPYTKDNIQLTTWKQNQINNYKHHSKPVICLVGGEVIAEYDSIRDAARDVNRQPAAIRVALKNQTRCAKMHWQYKQTPSSI